MATRGRTPSRQKVAQKPQREPVQENTAQPRGSGSVIVSSIVADSYLQQVIDLDQDSPNLPPGNDSCGKRDMQPNAVISAEPASNQQQASDQYPLQQCTRCKTSPIVHSNHLCPHISEVSNSNTNTNTVADGDSRPTDQPAIVQMIQR